jgi:hypothetical protein
MINTQSLARQFNKMGARVKVRERPAKSRFSSWRSIRNSTPSRNTPFVSNILLDKEGEYFDFLVTPDVTAVSVGHLDAKDRHLVLNVTESASRPGLKEETKHFLMGHDERHWFIAETSGTTVAGAKDNLKPAVVVDAERKVKVKKKNRNRRKTKAFVRQGEWFFLPAPRLDVDPKLIHRNEPIRRSGGKPHMVEELYREGGTTVMVGPGKYRNGIAMDRYNQLRSTNPDLFRGRPWRPETRNPTAYARGKVKHSDHKTVKLRGWHRIVGNSEIVGSASVAFLD